MVKTGKIKNWNDEKGFGFIEEGENDSAIFFHIGDVAESGGKPVDGASVVYERSQDARGRPCAIRVVCEGEPQKVIPFYVGSYASLLVVALFFAGLFASALSGYTPMVLAVWYLIVSLITYVGYSADKRAALTGGWRTPEETLHFISLIGGWPGAWAGQRLLRHKTKKHNFRVVFWLTVLVNLGVLGWVHTKYGSTIFDGFVDVVKGWFLQILES